MKAHLMMLIAGALLMGCGGTFHDTVSRGGKIVSSTTSRSGFLTTESSSDALPDYPKCTTQIGAMPEGEQIGLCVEQIQADAERRAWNLDMQSGRWFYQNRPPSAYVGGYPYFYPAR